VVAGRKILVTGAAGFIGSHLVETLLRREARVTAMIRYNSASSIGNLAFLPESLRAALTVLPGNIEDSDFVHRAVEGQEIVLHLAALIAIPYSYSAPRSYLRANVEGTLNVLEAVRRHGARRLVHTSTSEVYGTALRAPIDEDHPLQGQSPYSASKIGADKLVESFYRSYNLPAVTVRPFNTYGPRQSARAVIPTIITQVLTSGCVRLGNLDARRDFTYVRDTIDGFMKAADAQAVLGREINLGTGVDVSIAALVDKVVQITGRKVEIMTDNERLRPEQSEVRQLLSDNRLARQVLDWQPLWTLDEGLNETIAWIGQNLDFYQVGRYEI
jgi:NAD dependent epimerase/dehydratase